MIMKKIVVDGKEVYVPINREEAKEEMKKGNQLIFTDEDEKDELEDEIEDELDDEENEDEEDENEDDTNEEKVDQEDNNQSFKDSYHNFQNEFNSKFNKKFKDKFNKTNRIYVDGEKIAQSAGHLVNDINKIVTNATKGFTNLYSKKDDSGNPKSKTSKLLRVLPFMEDEDIHELIQDLLNGNDSLKDVNLMAILPFLSDDDCDQLFLKALEDGNFNFRPESIAPFVSEECLTKVVDLYLEGKYEKLNIDGLYPFLSSKDIKRVFKYIMSKEEK